MTSPIKLGKTYGVLHTESFFSFVGFAKKVASHEPQKVDVYVNHKLVDTIKANSFIQKIDDLYDVENSAFEYNLPLEYIGEKATISFKNHDSKEELLNSPYTLLDKTHEGFNEARFMHSLSEPLSEELKNMYKPNSIGFLAIKENLEDEEFVGYIKELMVRFPDMEFKGFYLREDMKQLSKNIFTNNKIQFIIPKDIYDVANNIEIYVSNANTPFDGILFKKIRINSKNTYCVWVNLALQKTSIQEYEISIKHALDIFMNHYEVLGFSADEISSDNSYSKTFQYAISTRFNLGEKTLDTSGSAYEYFNFQLVEYAFGNAAYKEFFFYHVLGQYKALYGSIN